jgi:glucose-6-phosphate isomerase
MGRIKIQDIPKDQKISIEEMRKVLGGSSRLEVQQEKDLVLGFFQGWNEKANQVDQQLTSILRTMKDLGRVGVGGSDLGAS